MEGDLVRVTDDAVPVGDRELAGDREWRPRSLRSSTTSHQVSEFSRRETGPGGTSSMASRAVLARRVRTRV